MLEEGGPVSLGSYSGMRDRPWCHHKPSFSAEILIGDDGTSLLAFSMTSAGHRGQCGPPPGQEGVMRGASSDDGGYYSVSM